MKFCSNCGTKLEDEDKFCMNCGAPTEQSEETGQKDDTQESDAVHEAQTETAVAEEEDAEKSDLAEVQEENQGETAVEAQAEPQTQESFESETAKVSLEKQEGDSKPQGYQINTGESQSQGYQINTGESQSQGYQINTGESQSQGYQINTGDNQGPVQQAAPMNAKTKKQLAVIGAVILVVIVAAFVVMKTVIFPGYKVPVKNLAKAIDKQKEKYVEDNVPKAYKAIKETTDMDYDELFTYSITKGNSDFSYEVIKKADYKIVEKKKLSEKRAKAIKNQLRDSMSSEKKISFDTNKCYALAVEFKLDNGDDKETFETVVYTAKDEGKWMLIAVKNVDFDDDSQDEE